MHIATVSFATSLYDQKYIVFHRWNGEGEEDGVWILFVFADMIIKRVERQIKGGLMKDRHQSARLWRGCKE